MYILAHVNKWETPNLITPASLSLRSTSSPGSKIRIAQQAQRLHKQYQHRNGMWPTGRRLPLLQSHSLVYHQQSHIINPCFWLCYCCFVLATLSPSSCHDEPCGDSIWKRAGKAAVLKEAWFKSHSQGPTHTGGENWPPWPSIAFWKFSRRRDNIGEKNVMTTADSHTLCMQQTLVSEFNRAENRLEERDSLGEKVLFKTQKPANICTGRA